MNIAQFTTSVDRHAHVATVQQAQMKVESPHIQKALISQQVRKEDVRLAVDNMNEFLQPVTTNIKFVYHEDLNDYYVTVVDPLTNEVVREIPPKKMLDMYVAMAEYMGLLVDEKV
ncbi:MAG TPA: flagellar protein FlaG [Pseudogracilibacillus sp.]|nr:flagellar protein FlaG [Pseudogracilibacillus sp.]